MYLCVVVLLPQRLYLSRMKNRHGHWVCWDVDGSKNDLIRTLTRKQGIGSVIAINSCCAATKTVRRFRRVAPQMNSCVAFHIAAGCTQFILSTINILSYSRYEAHLVTVYLFVLFQLYVPACHALHPLPHGSNSGAAWDVLRQDQNLFLASPSFIPMHWVNTPKSKNIPGTSYYFVSRFIHTNGTLLRTNCYLVHVTGTWYHA